MNSELKVTRSLLSASTSQRWQFSFNQSVELLDVHSQTKRKVEEIKNLI
jgi:hypothetical protein